MEVKEVDYNPEFIARMIPKVDWLALRQATEQVSYRAVLERDKMLSIFFISLHEITPRAVMSGCQYQHFDVLFYMYFLTL